MAGISTLRHVKRELSGHWHGNGRPIRASPTEVNANGEAAASSGSEPGGPVRAAGPYPAGWLQRLGFGQAMSVGAVCIGKNFSTLLRGHIERSSPGTCDSTSCCPDMRKPKHA